MSVYYYHFFGEIDVYIVTYASGLPLRTVKYCSVVLRVTLRLLVIHCFVVSRHQQTPPLTSD